MYEEDRYRKGKPFRTIMRQAAGKWQKRDMLKPRETGRSATAMERAKNHPILNILNKPYKLLNAKNLINV